MVGGWDRFLHGVAHPLGFRFSNVRVLRDAGLSPPKTRGVPGKGNRDAEGTPHKAGQSPALQSGCGQRARRRGRFAA